MRALITFVLCFWCWIAVQAADQTAASASRADVLTAYNAAAASGDRVIVPAGTAEWSSAITISKQVQIYGAGTNLTILTNTTSNGSGLEVPFFTTAMSNVIIGGFTFVDKDGDFDCSAITIGGGWLFGNIVNSNLFRGFNFAIKAYSPGLIYSNHFYNVDTLVRVQGFNTATDFDALGSYPPFGFNHTNYVAFEDNLIEHTNWNRGVATYYVDTEYPALYMIRHNAFHQDDDGNDGIDGFDMHGNGNGDGTSILVGPTIYKNELTKTAGVVDIKWLDLRGGGWSLNFSNNITGESGYNVFRDDPNPLGVLITNAFAWANTDDSGDGIMDYSASGGNVENTNYHLTSTNATILAYPHPWRALYFGEGGGEGGGTSNPGKGRGQKGTGGRGRFK